MESVVVCWKKLGVNGSVFLNPCWGRGAGVVNWTRSSSVRFSQSDFWRVGVKRAKLCSVCFSG